MTHTSITLRSIAKKALFTLVAATSILASATAQEKWQISLRPGAHIPLQKLGGVDLNTGYGADAMFAYRVVPHVYINAGWGWNRFSAKEEVEGTSINYDETGYMLGAQFNHPIKPGCKYNYFVGANAIYNHIEAKDGNDIIHDTDHGLGWQAEAGISIPFASTFNLMPGIRYHSLTRDNADLRYLSVGLNVAWNF